MGRDTPAAARLPRLWVVLVLIVSLLAAACGTRQSHDDVVAAAGGTRGATSSRGPTAAGAVETGATGTPALQQTPSGSDTTGPDNAGATQVGAPVENGPPGAGDTSPIIIGSVGNYSGPAGAAQKPGMQAVQAWVSYMNDHG